VSLSSAAGVAVLKMMGPATTTFVVGGIHVTLQVSVAGGAAAGGVAAGGALAGRSAVVAGGGLATGFIGGGTIAATAAAAIVAITPVVCAYVEGFETTCDASVRTVNGSIDPEDENSGQIKYVLASEEGCGNVMLYFFPSRATLEQGDKEFGFTCSRLHYQINHQGGTSELKPILQRGCAMPYPTIRAALQKFETAGCGQINGSAEWSD